MLKRHTHTHTSQRGRRWRPVWLPVAPCTHGCGSTSQRSWLCRLTLSLSKGSKEACNLYAATGANFTVPLVAALDQQDTLKWRHNGTSILHWKKQSFVIGRKESLSENGSLKLTGVQQGNAGSYIPEVHDVIGNRKGTFELMQLCVMGRSFVNISSYYCCLARHQVLGLTHCICCHGNDNVCFSSTQTEPRGPLWTLHATLPRRSRSPAMFNRRWELKFNVFYWERRWSLVQHDSLNLVNIQMLSYYHETQSQLISIVEIVDSDPLIDDPCTPAGQGSPVCVVSEQPGAGKGERSDSDEISGSRESGSHQLQSVQPRQLRDQRARDTDLHCQQWVSSGTSSSINDDVTFRFWRSYVTLSAHSSVEPNQWNKSQNHNSFNVFLLLLFPSLEFMFPDEIFGINTWILVAVGGGTSALLEAWRWHLLSDCASFFLLLFNCVSVPPIPLQEAWGIHWGCFITS